VIAIGVGSASPSVQRRLVLLGIIAAAIASAVWSAIERERSVELLTPTGTIRVALADTPERRSTGLSGREHVPHDGMLLLWDAPGRHPVWMREMRFALDLIWLDANGRVLSVLPKTPPCTREPCALYEPAGSGSAIAVLELPAGTAVERGIAIGAMVRATVFCSRSSPIQSPQA
jgi:uncharacterized membrane protein (UPF0127 family)